MLHARTADDPAAMYHDILDVLTTQAGSTSLRADDRPVEGLAGVHAALWQDRDLDSLRLQYVLAMWCKVSIDSSTSFLSAIY